MTQVKKRVKSGDSIGGSGSLFANKKGKRNIRISSRTYYRNKLVWMCHECANSESFFGFFNSGGNSSNESEGDSSNEAFWVLGVVAIVLIFGVIFIAKFAENNNTAKFTTNSPYQSDQSKRFIKYNSHKTEPNTVQKNCRKGVMFFDKAQGEWVDCVKTPNSNTNNTNLGVNPYQVGEKKLINPTENLQIVPGIEMSFEDSWYEKQWNRYPKSRIKHSILSLSYMKEANYSLACKYENLIQSFLFIKGKENNKELSFENHLKRAKTLNKESGSFEISDKVMTYLKWLHNTSIPDYVYPKEFSNDCKNLRMPNRWGYKDALKFRISKCESAWEKIKSESKTLLNKKKQKSFCNLVAIYPNFCSENNCYIGQDKINYEGYLTDEYEEEINEISSLEKTPYSEVRKELIDFIRDEFNECLDSNRRVDDCHRDWESYFDFEIKVN